MGGETISHYNVLEKSGQGGMGEVYWAAPTNPPTEYDRPNHYGIHADSLKSVDVNLYDERLNNLRNLVNRLSEEKNHR